MVAIPTTTLEIGFSVFAVRAQKTRGPIVEVKELVRPEDVRTHARVSVVDLRRTPHLVGAEGTVVRTYRAPERTALHVRLDDGRWQLLWPEEVELLVEDPETKRGGR